MGLVKAFDEHHAKEHGFKLGQGCCVVQKGEYAIVMLGETVGECGGRVADDRSLGKHKELCELVDGDGGVAVGEFRVEDFDVRVRPGDTVSGEC